MKIETEDHLLKNMRFMAAACMETRQKARVGMDSKLTKARKEELERQVVILVDELNLLMRVLGL